MIIQTRYDIVTLLTQLLEPVVEGFGVE
jgi:hypothetical protein